ncbi:MAG: hypothetical protein IMW88_04355 [Thermoflavifilum sp.]|uniref:hypothetical protein n=1 Tax=Thermoflavifilum sp. TaxID=1968839 RepID=UPI0018A3C178|nr:hypothetical protein [Thermoflavifilum sp.]QOR76773.1 MAG: hypothetical protein IMW88_04355 [Thermoflavifilum sp.]
MHESSIEQEKLIRNKFFAGLQPAKPFFTRNILFRKRFFHEKFPGILSTTSFSTDREETANNLIDEKIGLWKSSGINLPLY